MSSYQSQNFVAKDLGSSKPPPTVKIELPHNWDPRWYQLKLWCALQSGTKRAVAVWHRRAGKDDVALHWAAVAANDVGYPGCLGRVGNYWHMLPEAAQARKAIWDAVDPHTGVRRIDIAFPKELRAKTLEDQMLIKFKSGSTWQVVGSDNYDSLVGASPVGITFSEWALANPAAWAYLQPILLENKGWAFFIFTSRGRNHGYTFLRMAQKDPVWFAEVLTVDNTKFLDVKTLASARREYNSLYGKEAGDALYEQEYLCSFDAPILGSFYGSELNKAEQQGRIGKVDYDSNLPVHTAWDLGRSDDTAIWFFQVAVGEIRVIDFYYNHGQLIDHYVEVVKSKLWLTRVVDKRGVLTTVNGYGHHWIPWDGQIKTLASKGKSVIELLFDAGIRNIRVVKNVTVEQGIIAARQTLKRCWFDAERCEYGLEALRQYKRQFDDKKHAFLQTPVHDWASHPADGFRYLALVWSEPPPAVEEPLQRVELGIGSLVVDSGVVKSTKGVQEMIDYLAKQRRKREGR